MKRIAHLADIHIKLATRHEEYKEVFEKTYESLKEEKPDRIALVGDIVHNKTNMSPASISLMNEFFIKLSKIAPIDIFIGNHDINLEKIDQGDAITPFFNLVKMANSETPAIVVDSSNHKDIDFSKKGIYYFTETAFYKIADDLVYGVFSCKDGKKIVLDHKDPNVSYVAFWHGPVYGGRMDNGYECKDESAYKIGGFYNFDAVLMGDFHEFQTFDRNIFLTCNESDLEKYEAEGWKVSSKQDDIIYLKKLAPTAAYCGSLIQQNFGESLEKGYLVWTIDKQNTFFDRKLIPNEYGYSQINISRGENIQERIDNASMSSNPRKTKIILKIEDFAENKSQEKEEQIKKYIKSKYGCEYIKVDWITIDRSVIDEEITEEYDEENFFSILDFWTDATEHDYSEKELEEFKSFCYKIEKDLGIKTQEKIVKKYDLISAEVRNIFSFPDRPVFFDFEKMTGITGIFGENFCGKSNFLLAIIWGAYDEIIGSKSKKSLINIYTNSNKGYVKLIIKIDEKLYRITREVIKTKKGNSYPTRYEMWKTNFDEEGEWVEEITDEITGDIREVKNSILASIGDYEDCSKTALHVAGSPDDYLSLKQQPKNDLIGRYLGLNDYRTRYDYIKKKHNELIAKQKHLGNITDLELALSERNLKLNDLQSDNDSQLEKQKLLSIKKEDVNSKIIELTSQLIKLHNVPYMSIFDITNQIEKLDIEFADLDRKLQDLQAWIDKNPAKEIPVNFDKTESEYEAEIERLKKESETLSDRIEKGKEWVSKNEKKLVLPYENESTRLDQVKNLVIEFQNKIILFQGNNCKYCNSSLQAADPEKEKESRDKLEELNQELSNLNAHISLQKENTEFNSSVDRNIANLNLIESKLSEVKLKLSQEENNLISIKSLSDSIVHNNKVADNLKKYREVEQLIKQLESKKRDLQLHLKNFQENSINRSKNEDTQNKIDELKIEYNNFTETLKALQMNLISLSGSIKVIESEIQENIEKINEVKEYDKKYKQYSFYLQAVHRDGIPALIIKNKLSVINYKINSILANVVDFKVDLEIDIDGNITEVFYFADNKFDALPLERASGAQKFVISLAIKNALYDISSHSSAQPTFIMIDEGFGTLDDNMVADILNVIFYLKTKYKNVLIITHRNEIKDASDNIILVTKDRAMITKEDLDNNPNAGVSSFSFT